MDTEFHQNKLLNTLINFLSVKSGHCALKETISKRIGVDSMFNVYFYRWICFVSVNKVEVH